MHTCFGCQGKGWVPDGDIEDGMLTGRQECHVCGGRGKLSNKRILAAIRNMLGHTGPAT